MVRKFELLQLRAKARAESRKYIDQADAENRDMNSEEKSAFDKCMADIDSLDKRITALEQYEASEPDEAVVEENSRSHNRMAVETRSLETRDNVYASKEYRTAWLRGHILNDKKNQEYRTFNTTAATGGYQLTPIQVVSDIIQLWENICIMKKFATKFKASSPTARVPLLSTNVGNAVFGATEVTAPTADTTSAESARDLVPHVFHKLVKFSILWSELSNAESLVVSQIARSFAYGLEDKILNGAGVGSTEPLGLFTASSSGISTGRDVDSGSATSITADSLFDMKFKIKQQYLNDPSVGWVMHRDVMKVISKLKDSYGRYLLENNNLTGGPDRLLGYPVYLSEFAPNTFTASKYLAILGCLNQYGLAEVDDVQLVRLGEIYQGTHEIGYIARTFCDGAPILEEAFARLITSAS